MTDRALASFRVGSEVPDAEKAVKALKLTRKVMAFDQTLTHTGWVVFIPSPANYPLVGDVGTFHHEGNRYPEVKSHELSLMKSGDLFDEVGQLMEAFQPEVIVVEYPPVGPVSRPESSLMAAEAIYLTARAAGVPLKLVDNQQAKSVIVGRRGADKKELRAVLDQMYPGLPERFRMNEHVYDAIALGHTAVSTGKVEAQ